MATRTVSARLDEGLVDWMDGYALERSTPEARVTRTMILETALEAFRADAAGGVPELRRPAAPEPAAPAVDKPTRADFAAAAAERAALFAGLRVPQSVRGTAKPKGGGS
jgi:hypothetical protein